MRNMTAVEFLDRVKRLNRQTDQELLAGTGEARDRLALAIHYELTQAKDKDGTALDEKYPNLTKGLRVAQQIVQARIARFDDSFTDYVEGKGSFENALRGGPRFNKGQRLADAELKAAMEAFNDSLAKAPEPKRKLINSTDGSMVGRHESYIPKPEPEVVRPSKSRLDGRVGRAQTLPKADETKEPLSKADMRRLLRETP